mmetsp:Transcript_34922/g.26066  ORF Transcript_34922/g.26066 Transcript_34922/m.26066 type:complete len:167 (-) Transcript_34922:775-1275(-)
MRRRFGSLKSGKEKEDFHKNENEKDNVKNLEQWEQQNTNTELNFYAANLKLKISSTVCKRRNDSPRLNTENLNLIFHDPENAKDYDHKREEHKINEVIPARKYEDFQENSDYSEEFDEGGNIRRRIKKKELMESKKFYDLSTKENVAEQLLSQLKPYLRSKEQKHI